MAKANITQYSSTPSSNTDINNINIDENCPASGLNNAIRELMAHLKNVDTGSQALTALSVTGDTTISSGNLLVGTTDTTPYNNTTADDGVAISGSGWIATSRNNNASGLFNLTGDDGDILDLRKDGTTVGSIGTVGGDLIIGTGDTGLFFNDSTNQIHPYNIDSLSGGSVDGAIDLGQSGVRFKDLYLSGGAYIGGTGSANYLDDYEEGSHSITFTNVAFNPSSQNAIYTKIGNVVIYVGTITFPSSSDTNDINISLPFNNTSRNSIGVFLSNGVTDKVLFTGGSGANYMRIYPDNSFSQNNYSNLSGITIYFTITYQTT